MDLALLTVFLVMRTFLTIYISSVNGKIVKAIIQKDLNLFIKRVQIQIPRFSGWV
jgi:ATP-binding cassette subfamily D (ALD) protein 3